MTVTDPEGRVVFDLGGDAGDIMLHEVSVVQKISSVLDCNGDAGGTAYLDSCQTCVGGNTGKTACAEKGISPFIIGQNIFLFRMTK